MIALDIVIGGLLLGGLYALIATGFNLQYGVARVLNIAYGEFLMLGAMGTYSFYKLLGINPLLSVFICGAILFLVGYVIHVAFFNRLRRLSGSTEAFENVSLLICFGLLFLIQNLALLGWGAQLRGYTFLNNSVDILGAIFAVNRLLVLLFAVVIGLGFYLFLLRTRLGKAIRAATDERTSAQMVGINIRWMNNFSFALGAALAGLAGGLLSTIFQVSPTMGFPYTIIAIIVIVLGGLGNIIGGLAAGLILGVAGSAVSYFDPGLSLVVYYLIFMLILLVRPKGIFGK